MQGCKVQSGRFSPQLILCNAFGLGGPRPVTQRRRSRAAGAERYWMRKSHTADPRQTLRGGKTLDRRSAAFMRQPEAGPDTARHLEPRGLRPFAPFRRRA